MNWDRAWSGGSDDAGLDRYGARWPTHEPSWCEGGGQASTLSRWSGSTDRSESGKRPRPAKVVGGLAAVVSGLLEADWSPLQQIATMLPILYPDDETMRASHEKIYQSLFVQGRGEPRRELVAHLRAGTNARKPQGRTERRGKIVGMTPISQRPAEVDDRAVPGHWESQCCCQAASDGLARVGS